MNDVSDYRRNLAYNAGKKARQQNKPTSANNRQEGTIYADDWWDGWNDEDNRITFGEEEPLRLHLPA